MYQVQCSCFCGCEQILVFDTKPRGDPECQRCRDGECVNEHYEKTHSLEGLHRRSVEKLQTCTDVMQQIQQTMAVIIGPRKENGNAS
jgi:hypothetical protein